MLRLQVLRICWVPHCWIHCYFYCLLTIAESKCIGCLIPSGCTPNKQTPSRWWTAMHRHPPFWESSRSALIRWVDNPFNPVSCQPIKRINDMIAKRRQRKAALPLYRHFLQFELSQMKNYRFCHVTARKNPNCAEMAIHVGGGGLLWVIHFNPLNYSSPVNDRRRVRFECVRQHMIFCCCSCTVSSYARLISLQPISSVHTIMVCRCIAGRLPQLLSESWQMRLRSCTVIA